MPSHSFTNNCCMGFYDNILNPKGVSVWLQTTNITCGMKMGKSQPTQWRLVNYQSTSKFKNKITKVKTNIIFATD